ncbi:FAD dependent oxidoreductase [Trametopsis cervina]|nr:FAD dependent oxidoreductase [Trametopsis cervina]
MPTTVILGTGIIGLSTAYYLSQFAEQEQTGADTPKHEIHLVEATPELFASASGKAAGFLAKDWFTPAVTPLGEFSFNLHRKLAEEHDGRTKWGYSPSTSYSLDRDDSEDEDEGFEDDESVDERVSQAEPSTTANSEGFEGDESADERASQPEPSTTANTSSQPRRTRKNDLDWLMNGSSRMSLLDESDDLKPEGEDDLPRWLRARRSSLQTISDRTTTGQVDPYRLCQFLLQTCRARGVKLHQPACATQLQHIDPEDPTSPTSIRIEFLQPRNSDANGQHTRSSPNSLSPPTEVADGAAINASDYIAERRDSWSSFSSALNGSPRAAEALRERLNASSHNGSGTSPRDNDVIDIQCDSIVITAGCWTPRVYRTLFPNAGRIPRVTALAGHSIVLKSKHWPTVQPDPFQDLATPRFSPAAATAPSPSTAASVQTSPNTSPESAPGVASPTSSESSSTITAFRPTPTVSPEDEPKSYPFPSLTEEPLAPVSPHPITIPQPSGCHAVFTNDPAGYSPEIFSRLSGDIWLGGYNSSSIPLPALASSAIPHASALSALLDTARSLCGEDVEVVREALCFRPVAPTGRPVVARMHEADLGDGVKVAGGVFVATGHGPWGISLGLGTGWVVGEMVLGKETSVDVSVLGKWEAQAI